MNDSINFHRRIIRSQDFLPCVDQELFHISCGSLFTAWLLPHHIFLGTQMKKVANFSLCFLLVTERD